MPPGLRGADGPFARRFGGLGRLSRRRPIPGHPKLALQPHPRRRAAGAACAWRDRGADRADARREPAAHLRAPGQLLSAERRTLPLNSIGGAAMTSAVAVVLDPELEEALKRMPPGVS